MTKKDIFKKTIYPLLMAFLFFITASLSFVTFAWLANFIQSGDFNFQTQELPPLTLEIAKITPNESTAVSEANRTYTTVSDYKIEAKADGTKLDVELQNMTFGVIDNIAQLKEENRVYFRLTVPKNLADSIKLEFYYKSADFLTVYTVQEDDTGTEIVTEVTDNTANHIDVITNLIAIEQTAGAYLKYNAMISATPITAPNLHASLYADYKGEEFKDFKVNTEGIFSQSTDQSGTTATNYFTFTNQNLTNSENYYVYICVEPNLDVFGYSIDLISDLMPCRFFFNIGLTVECLPTANTQTTQAKD